MNVLFDYQYRDGSNCHRHGYVIFGNRTNMDIDEIYQTLTPCFDDGQGFIASQIGIPERFHWKPGEGEDYFPPHEEDHCWHTFDNVSPIQDGVTDEQERDILDFLIAVRDAGQAGWQTFDPVERDGKGD